MAGAATGAAAGAVAAGSAGLAGAGSAPPHAARASAAIRVSGAAAEKRMGFQYLVTAWIDPQPSSRRRGPNSTDSLPQWQKFSKPIETRRWPPVRRGTGRAQRSAGQPARDRLNLPANG
ncbi:MAG: hypothetical protein C0456_09350 [Hyphomonas sp.]|nr:hypothetical protein [Hyphomonas sp.]